MGRIERRDQSEITDVDCGYDGLNLGKQFVSPGQMLRLEVLSAHRQCDQEKSPLDRPED